MPQYINTNNSFFNPYCFSPVSKRVYSPWWKNMISQDIPFSDSISGSIDVTFEALTPIIVKEGKTNPSSVNLNGKYFIPGTSIKGMIRNVLEVLSLSKIGPRIKDSQYSLRDLTPANVDYQLKTNQGNIKAGLLVKLKGQYCLIESPDFKPLSYELIGDLLEIDGENIKNAAGVSQKYGLLNGLDPFLQKEPDDIWVLVFTGKMQNKRNEYCVKIPNQIKVNPLSDKAIKDFLFIYEQENKSKSWIFWKKQIQDFAIKPTFDQLSSELCFAPIFYTKKGETIESLGLAFLHRELYKYSVHDFLKENQKSDDLDLAQCIFGSSEHDLKGRVQFSHAFVNMKGKQVEENPDEIVLGSPKPTFYPFYLKQSGNQASTFSDPDGQINGWKRYLVHEEIVIQTFPNNNQNVRTKIKPLPKGITFTSKIKFHNLKPEELGALLSAITFHNNSDKCFHLIGMAKPLGYGKLKLNETKLLVSEKPNKIQDYMAIFEKELCTEGSNNLFDEWKKDISPLFKIASGNFKKPIHYPVDFTKFKEIKTNRMSIADFSPPLDNFELVSLSKQIPKP